MKELWNKIATWQRYIIAAIVFIWLGGWLCTLPIPGGLVLAAFLSALILLICGFSARGDLQ